MTSPEKKLVSNKRSKTQPNTFIIRIWDESIDEDGIIGQWHGSIDHVGDDKHLYFCSFESIYKFICEQTGIVERPRLRWWQLIFTSISTTLFSRTKKRKDSFAD